MNQKAKSGDKFFQQLRDAGVADDEFERDIVIMFLEEGSESLKKLKSAYSDRDWSPMKMYAHKLKSSFLMFEMQDAHDLAVRIEENTIDNPENLGEIINQLSTNCDSGFIQLKSEYEV